MKLFKRSLLLIISSISILAAMEPAIDTNILVSNDGQEFVIPQEIVLESETIKALSSMVFEESSTRRIQFRELSALQLQEISQFMWAWYHHKDLKGKALLDAIEKEMGNKKVDDIITFLHTSHFLDIKPAIAFAARSIVKLNPDESFIKNFIEQCIDKSFGAINDMGVELARYYCLITGNWRIKIDDSHDFYGFSIQDYLDYQPEVIQIRTKHMHMIHDPKLCLGDLKLNNLEGLHQISLISIIKELDLSYNQIRKLPAEIFRLSNLEHLELQNNQIEEISAEAFVELPNLNNLKLQNNQIRELPDAFIRLNNLRVLSLANNQFIEISKQVFARMNSLQSLSLEHNELPQENITDLKNQLPNTVVYYY